MDIRVSHPVGFLMPLTCIPRHNEKSLPIGFVKKVVDQKARVCWCMAAIYIFGSSIDQQRHNLAGRTKDPISSRYAKQSSNDRELEMLGRKDSKISVSLASGLMTHS